MDVEARQRARDRAADGVATREQVRLGETAWAAPALAVSGMGARERKRIYRARAKAKEQQS